MRTTEAVALFLLGTMLLPDVEGAGRIQIPAMSTKTASTFATRSIRFKHHDRNLFMAFDPWYIDEAFSMPAEPTHPSPSVSAGPAFTAPTLRPSTVKHPSHPGPATKPSSSHAPNAGWPTIPTERSPFPSPAHPATVPTADQPSRGTVTEVPTSRPKPAFSSTPVYGPPNAGWPTIPTVSSPFPAPAHPATVPTADHPSSVSVTDVPTSSPIPAYSSTPVNGPISQHWSHPTALPNEENPTTVRVPTVMSHSYLPTTAGPESASDPHGASPIRSPNRSDLPVTSPTQIPTPPSKPHPTGKATNIPSSHRPVSNIPIASPTVTSPPKGSSSTAPSVSDSPNEVPPTSTIDSPSVDTSGAPFPYVSLVPNPSPLVVHSPVVSETGAPYLMPNEVTPSSPGHSPVASTIAPSAPPDDIDRPSYIGAYSALPTQTEPVIGDGSCHTEQGKYGTVGGPSTIATFGYELETTRLSSEGELALQILPPLEASMSNYLLPYLFENCNKQSRQLLVVKVDASEANSVSPRRFLKELLAGMSAQPADLPIQDVSCRNSSRSRADIDCWVIRGEMELFYAPSSRRHLSDGSDETEIRRVLRKAMEEGAFVGVHPSIVRVSYVDLSELETDQGRERDRVPTGVASSTTDSPSSDPMTVHQALLIGFVAFAAVGSLLLGLLLARRRRHGRRHPGDPLASQRSGDDTLLGESLATPSLPTIVVPSATKGTAAAHAATSPLTLEGPGSADLDGLLTEAPSDASVYLEGSEGGTTVAPPSHRGGPTAAAMAAQGLALMVDSLCPGGAVDDDVQEKWGSATKSAPLRRSVRGPGPDDRAPYNLQSPTDDSVYMLESDDGSRDGDFRSLQN